jgi:antitoxin component YwqK of YwqJK toxin-antitoxin module
MIGYTYGFSDDEKEVVVTLDIPDDALTNMSRSNILNRDTATYRTNKARVVRIEDEDGKTYSSAISTLDERNALAYILDQTLVVKNYDEHIETIYGSGITYFLKIDVARSYGIKIIPSDGIFRSWYSNGILSQKLVLKDGKLNGLCERYDINGDVIEVSRYKNGIKL